MAYTTPVTDRTQADVDARRSKGMRNLSDLNRVEENCRVLATKWGISVNTRSWTRTDLPTAADFTRMLQNVGALRAASGLTPKVNLTWDDLDALKRLWSEIRRLRQTWDDLTVRVITAPAPPFNTWQKWNDAEMIQKYLYENE